MHIICTNRARRSLVHFALHLGKVWSHLAIFLVGAIASFFSLPDDHAVFFSVAAHERRFPLPPFALGSNIEER